MHALYAGVSVNIKFQLREIPGCATIDSVIRLYLVLFELVKVSSKVTVPFDNPSNNAWELPLLRVLRNSW